MHGGPSSLLDRLVGLCLTMLIGATALYVAVHLIEAVWTALLIIAAVGLFVAVAIALLRSRSNNGW